MSTVTQSADWPQEGPSWFRIIIGIVFKVVVFVCMAPVVVPVVAEGLRYMIPYMATKVHRLPLPIVPFFRRWEGWNRLDLAMFFAVVVPLVSFFLVWINLRIYLMPQDPPFKKVFEPGMFAKVTMTMAVVFLVGEAILFYMGVTQQGGMFGGGGFSFPSLIATALYIGATVVVALISLMIDKA